MRKWIATIRNVAYVIVIVTALAGLADIPTEVKIVPLWMALILLTTANILQGKEHHNAHRTKGE